MTCNTRGAAAFIAIGALVLAGCGEDDFKNEPRPAVAVELTGTIKDDKVTLSPSKVGAGPVTITVSNQTDAAHSLTLEGEATTTTVGPVPPLDTATIQKTLEPGTYELKAGSKAAVPKEIAPAALTIGKSRGDSSDELLLP